MMTASTSLRNSRIAEEEITFRDNEPLLQHTSDTDDPDFDNVRRSLNDRLPSTYSSVVFITTLICVFILVISTVCFGFLYYKVSESNCIASDWPEPSNSLLGEYSTAAVASDNEFCSEIGRDILLQGGNAVEAAIATLFCIGVLDVQSSGLGGGHLLTFFNATTRKCYVIDAREVAPAKAFEEMYRDRYKKAQHGWEAPAVPGELHGMWTAYKEFGGNLPWYSLVSPTIRLMKEGYPTSGALAKVLKLYETNITNDLILSKSFLNPKTGKIYQRGEQITSRQNFIQTLEILSNSADPVQEFYNGKLTKLMVKEFQENGGLITEEDFRSYKSILRSDDEVIYTDLQRGLCGCGPPPPSGAAVTLSILKILNDFKSNTTTPEGNVDIFHRYLEASKFAYATRSELGDINYVKEALNYSKNITSDEWTDKVRHNITDEAHPTEYYGGDFKFVPDHGTSHISIIDKFGNAVSVTSTINLYLGALIMSESTGIVWNDEMDDFSLPGHPNYFDIPPSPSNYIKPGKRPQSSMSPLVLFSDEMTVSIGAAGGSQIISGVAYAAMHLLFLNRTIKQAIDYPRLHNQLRPNFTEVEQTFLPAYLTMLKERGQTFRNLTGGSVVTGAMKMHSSGKVYANSDFRKGWESEPAGY